MWESLTSIRQRAGGEPPPGGGRNAEEDFRGQKRCNATHASTTDPEALHYRKAQGTASMLCYQGHRVTENLSVRVVGAAVGWADWQGPTRDCPANSPAGAARPWARIATMTPAGSCWA